MCDPLNDSSLGEVGDECIVVCLTIFSDTIPLARTSIVSSMRIDGNNSDRRVRGAGQNRS